MKMTYKVLGGVIGVLVIAGGGYYFVSKNLNSSASLNSSSGATTSQEISVTQDTSKSITTKDKNLLQEKKPT